MVKHADPLIFWRDKTLYDKMEPIPEAVHYLTELSKTFQIVFVSACFSEHENSKRKFLDKFFPFHSGFISTSDKKFIKCDYFIDDYFKYCNQLHETGVKTYQIKTLINSKHEDIPYMDWKEIFNDIQGHSR